MGERKNNAGRKSEANGLVGKKAKPVPKPEKEIGIDVDGGLADALLTMGDSSKVDLSSLGMLDAKAQSRESMYSLIDTMSDDDRVSSVLETYAEDITDANEAGRIVWCDSSEADVSKYVTNLLDRLDVEKNIYGWAYSLCKYGDLYLRLYRESDYDDDPIFGTAAAKRDGSGSLNEAVKVSVPGANDRYVPYVEMVPNPGEMFDLAKFGKTVGYVSAPIRVQSHSEYNYVESDFFTYNLNRGDVTVYQATDFVHAMLNNDNTTRTPEEVKIFYKNGPADEDQAYGAYKVKRGQSMLFNLFRVWRELSLMESTVLLNRLTKSALTRILQVEVGDMPAEKVKTVLSFLKSKLEQKTALDKDSGIQEYTNPGPVENLIYMPTHGGQGAITAQTIGGDYDPKSLVDLNYFLDKFYGGLRVPKQYFGATEDSTGFNGGSSLSILSSRYGKAVKRVQSALCQMITSLVNIFLLDRGLSEYVNNFTIRMQAPMTQEELDRRENMRNRMGVMNDIMNQINDVVSDDVIKAKIVKSLLSQIVTNPEVIELLQKQIESEEAAKKGEGKEGESPDDEPKAEPAEGGEGEDDFGAKFGYEPDEAPEAESPEAQEPEAEPEASAEPGANTASGAEPAEGGEGEEGGQEGSYLPSPAELGMDLTGGTK